MLRYFSLSASIGSNYISLEQFWEFSDKNPEVFCAKKIFSVQKNCLFAEKFTVTTEEDNWTLLKVSMCKKEVNKYTIANLILPLPAKCLFQWILIRP